MQVQTVAYSDMQQDFSGTSNYGHVPQALMINFLTVNWKMALIVFLSLD